MAKNEAKVEARNDSLLGQLDPESKILIWLSTWAKLQNEFQLRFRFRAKTAEDPKTKRQNSCQVAISLMVHGGLGPGIDFRSEK